MFWFWFTVGSSQELASIVPVSMMIEPSLSSMHVVVMFPCVNFFNKHKLI